MKTIIVGAGPRGLILAERLISNYAQTKKGDLSIQLIDPFDIGGRVWLRNQNPLFLMNSAIQQLTFFTDDAVKMNGPIENGPNFYTWTKTVAKDYLASFKDDLQAKYFLEHLDDLKLNDYPSRALLNYYATWFFEQLVTKANALNINLTYTKSTVKDIIDAPGDVLEKYAVITDDNTYYADEITMALGHSDHTLSPKENQLNEYAKMHNLMYVAPMHPAQADLGQIPANKPTLIRGLGLNFFDYMIQLSTKRGGQFIADADNKLKYIKSGDEPLIIAGSRSGLPLHAKGINQKTQETRYKPHFLTEEKINELTENHTKNMPYSTFNHLFVSEMQFVYYTNLVKELGLKFPNFEEALLSSNNLNQTASEFGFSADDLFMLDRILKPFGKFDTMEEYQVEMMNYLQNDIDDSAKGNLDAPYTAAFDLIRDIRDRIRILIEGNGFSNDDRKLFLTDFNALSSLISVGPPRLRIQQMLALMEAGVLKLIPANFEVVPVNGQFKINTTNPDDSLYVDSIIEARLGAIDLHHSKNPLEVNLRDKHIMTSASYLLSDESVYSTGALVVDRKSYELIASDGSKTKSIRAYGVPTEKYMWFTTSLPRPYGNDRMLRDADHIARLMLKLE